LKAKYPVPVVFWLLGVGFAVHFIGFVDKESALWADERLDGKLREPRFSSILFKALPALFPGDFALEEVLTSEFRKRSLKEAGL
jgi:hypothetical protein